MSRIKGVIRIGSAWGYFNRIKDEHDLNKVAYRRDTRIEIISERDLDWSRIEKDTLTCRAH